MSYKTSISKTEFITLAHFRYQLRCFLRFSEEAAKGENITSLQYQLMLQIKGVPKRRWALIGELAERLQMAPHGVVALVSRCERDGLVARVADKVDRRQVRVFLTDAGARAVRRIALLHKDELASLSALVRAMQFSRSAETRREPPA
jgi:DNA-binding MarR family transcriptional regulator